MTKNEIVKYCFIIALFGNRHRGMLLPLLYSISKTNPQANITLLWEEIDENFISLVKKCFSKVEFVKTNFNFSNDITKRISSKTLLWEYAASIKSQENLIFIDADTVILKDISRFFSDSKAQIIFTVDHNNKYPINTGVMFGKMTPAAQSFFFTWRKETEKVLNNPELYQQANNKNLSYGGADQMSFQRLVKFKKHTDYYKRDGLLIQGMPRNWLNETNSVPISDKTHIIHYKGGWNDIFYKGRNFTSRRPKKESWEMYTFYLKNYIAAIDYFNSKTESNYSLEDFGIIIPFYVNKKTLTERRLIYPIYYLWSWIKNLIPRAKLFYLERIKN